MMAITAAIIAATTISEQAFVRSSDDLRPLQAERSPVSMDGRAG